MPCDQYIFVYICDMGIQIQCVWLSINMYATYMCKRSDNNNNNRNDNNNNISRI